MSSRRVSPSGALRNRRPGKAGEALTFYGFISPWLLGLICLTLFPVGYAIYLSFTAWDGIAPFKPWVGLDNYREVLTSPDTWSSLSRTLLLVVAVVPLTLVGSLVLALLLNERFRGRTTYRTLIYLPAIVPPVAASLIWKVVFDRDAGVANRILGLFGADAVSWFTGGRAFVVLVVVMLWAIGAGIIINIAALQAVPQDQVDAARVEGASAFRIFWHVTLPAISPVQLFQAVLVTITTLQTFVPAILLSPASNSADKPMLSMVPPSNRVYMVDVYGQYFTYSRYGYASAMLTVFFVVILALTAVIFKVAGRTVFYTVDPYEDRKAG
jgi:multiple sugar transport system permease protein